MHCGEVVDELDVALLAIEPRAELLRQVLDGVHGVHLLVGHLGHAWVALDPGASKEGRLNELANRLSSREEKGGTRFKVWSLIPVAWSVSLSTSSIAKGNNKLTFASAQMASLLPPSSPGLRVQTATARCRFSRSSLRTGRLRHLPHHHS